MNDTFSNNQTTQIRSIVREETADIRADLKKLQEDFKAESILAETGRSEVTKMLGMLSDNLKVSTKVADHESRVKGLVARVPLIQSTVTLHTKQINIMRGVVK